MDPLVLLPQYLTFARVPRCGKCGKLKGAVSILYTAPKGVAAKWTGTSEAMLAEVYGSSRRALWFEAGDLCLVPKGYKGEIKQQTEMAEENVQLNGAVVTIDEKTGRATEIKRVRERLEG